MFFTGLGFLQASGMAFSQNMTLKTGFPNQNPLDKKSSSMWYFPPSFFSIILVLFFWYFICLFETGYHCGWPEMHWVNQTGIELTEMSLLLPLGAGIRGMAATPACQHPP